MKTIYNIKALCVMALLGSVATVSAQEDKTKEKNLNREMTLEREYDPTVQDASKVNTVQQTPRLFQLRRRYVSEPERRLRLPHPEHGQG